MSYIKTTWVNGQAPAINQTNLNKIEDGIEDVDTRLTTTETLIGKDVNSHTTIGTNDVRATRFVPLLDPVQVVAGVDPTNTNFNDVDVTAHTSANCYAITGTCAFNSPTANRRIFIKSKDGNATTGDASVTFWTANNPVAGAFTLTSFNTGVDANQVFSWGVNNADVTAVFINITGYWEYVD